MTPGDGGVKTPGVPTIISNEKNVPSSAPLVRQPLTPIGQKYSLAKSIGGLFGADFISNESSEAPGGLRPNLWVSQWVDYTSKYGVGYKLCDGSPGIYFNDSTKMVVNGDTFEYITRRTQDKPESHTSHTFDAYPDELKKKVTLLRHFGVYMNSEDMDKRDGVSTGKSRMPIPDVAPKQSGSAETQTIYVRKWTRNKHAVLFQLSNKLVQVIFTDKTELFLSVKQRGVTFVDKDGDVSEYPFHNSLEVPTDLLRRIHCARDILLSLRGGRGGDQGILGQ